MTHKYLVLNENNRPMTIGHYDDTPRGGVLVNGDSAKPMSYTTARRAITRTREYARNRNLRWSCERYSLMRIDNNAS